MSLTDIKCRTAKAKEKPYKLYDFEGLYLEVRPTGTKFWRVKYRVEGQESTYTIGSYPIVPLSEARLKRSELKLSIHKGVNPHFKKTRSRALDGQVAGLCFGDLARQWHEKNFANWGERHSKTIMHRLEKYIFPDLQHCSVRSISPTMILDCLRKIEVKAPEMTRRVKQYCSKIFKYGIATGEATSDPTFGLEAALKKYSKGHFASIDIEELPKFLKKFYDSEHLLPRQTFLALKLMLLTFVRTSELIEAKWPEFDLGNSVWIIPAERMKMKREHVVPLSTQAIQAINELKNISGHREFVFPSLPYPKLKPMSKNALLTALRLMNYNQKMTGHGFRSLAMGIIKEKLGYSHEVVDRQLAHVPKNNVDRAYDRSKFLTQRTEMMQKYSDYLDVILK